MWIKLSLAVAGALMVLPANAFASENVANHCVDVSVPKNAVIARNGKWIALTREQWEFLRGVYVLNPETPAGLPYGDRAVLAQLDNDSGGLVFFIDGDKACTPMRAPPELLTLMDQVATATINHEGTGL
jgi:hypothetical protein